MMKTIIRTRIIRKDVEDMAERFKNDLSCYVINHDMFDMFDIDDINDMFEAVVEEYFEENKILDHLESLKKRENLNHKEADLWQFLFIARFMNAFIESLLEVMGKDNE